MILLTLLVTFAKIGLFTIGGGYAMIPMIKDEVMAHGWISANELIDFIAVSESTPGPFAINIATFIGTNTAGFWGAVFATFGVVLPSFIIILLVAKFFTQFKENFYVKSALSGLRPAVIGLIAAAVWYIGVKALAPNGITKLDYRSFIILGIVFVIGRWKKNLHPIFIVLISGVLGIFIFGL